ncbi:MAG: GTP-binding protein [Candidatus Helarchaeota archaeon]|nr:GTP-binding protein [Candidatus Helarchaeota archaeon]
MSASYKFKLVLFGNAAVGKTSLVERYINNRFEGQYLSTLGYNVYEKKIDISETGEISVTFVIFDIGGQEQFKELRKKYAAGAQAALLVYSIIDRDSFENIPNWHSDLKAFTDNAHFIIVGNKLDLEDSRQVVKEEGESLAQMLQADGFFETSAKADVMINETFYSFAKIILDKSFI